MRVAPLLSFPVLFAVALADGRTAAEAAKDGNRLLAQGQYGDAARAYGEAIQADPTSYVNFYKRATAYLSLGKHSAALDDFDEILKLNPDFSQAYYQKAKILAKDGEFVSASTELQSFAKSKNKKQADEADAEHLLANVGAAAKEEKNARAAAKAKKWEDCVAHATRALEVGPNSASLRELRVECNTELGEAEGAYADLSRLAILRPASQELRLRLAYMSYFLLDTAIAVNEVKKCLHFDPDHKGCKKLHKLFRGIERDLAKARTFIEGGNPRKGLQLLRGEEGIVAKFDAAMDEALAADLIPPQFHAKEKSQTRANLYGLACSASVDAGDFTAKAAVFCDTVLQLDPENEAGLVFRGERLLKDEKWEEAVATFQKAFEKSGRQSQDVMNRMQKAQRLLKVSKQKDYYKILGVSRDADERTVRKAFRKAAKTNHPDVGGSEEKMAQINEAYEVLSDPELRARFDNGDDPNDPTGGQGGNPFAHHGGGMPFFFNQGGGGFPGGGFPGGGGGQKFHYQWGG